MDFLGGEISQKNKNNFGDNGEDENELMKDEREKYCDFSGFDLSDLKKLEKSAKFRLFKEKKEKKWIITKFRNKIYQTMTEPRSSLLAMIVGIFLGLVILMAVAVFMAQSWPSLWDRNSLNTTWFLLETFIIGVFTIEFSIRMITCPNKYDFFFSIWTVFDVAAIVPYFAYCILVLTENDPFDPSWIAILKTIRLFLLVRLLKLGKYTTFFEAGYNALVNSWDVYILFGAMLLLDIFFFASLIFYAEQYKETFDQSIPAWVYTIENPWKNSQGPFQSVSSSLYWTVVTAATVGYGDQYPITGLGKFFASLCMITGVIMFGFPVGILGVRFSEELDLITANRSRKLYGYKNDDMIAKKRLKKVHKRLIEFQRELLNMRDLFDQLADANSDLIRSVDHGLTALEN